MWVKQKVKFERLTLRASIIIVCILTSIALWGQDSFGISYGQTFSLGRLADKYQFEISHQGRKFILEGNNFNSFRFDTPGIYTIQSREIINSKYFGKKILQDEHDNLPSNFVIYVDSIQFEFDSESIAASDILSKGKNIGGTELYIEVEIKNFYSTPISFPSKVLKVKAAGIGAAVDGVLVKTILLNKPHRFRFVYSLQGQFNERGYIQFDFEKFNGQLSPIGWREEIK